MTTLSAELDRTRRARERLEEMAADPSLLDPHFEPIQSVADDAITGWRIRGRVQPDPELGSREDFVRTARSLGLAERLDWALRCHALGIALTAGTGADLHFRAAVESYGHPCPPRLAVQFSRVKGQRVVAELHPDALDDKILLESGIEDFRRWGWRIALGDVSTRADSVALFEHLQPDVIHLDLKAGTGTAAQGRLAEAARAAHGQVIVSGVDDHSSRTAAIALGATQIHGRLVGLPTRSPA